MTSIANEFIAAVVASNPIQGNYIGGCYDSLAGQEKESFTAYLEFLTRRGLPLSYLLECYNTIVEDIKREQIYFLRNKKYRYSTYAEVCDSVYLNDGYMERYMYGLGITSFLWSNHVELNRFFAAHLPRQSRGRYLEVGPGHGLHFLTAMRLCSYDAYHAVDISPKSAALTKDLVGSGLMGQFNCCEILVSDFLKADLPGAPYDALVMGEVLEHVEQPEAFLRRAQTVTSPDAFIYLTTAINAPAIDHIFLLRHANEFDALLKRTGFSCRHQLLLPYKGKTLKECEAQNLPINLAAVLTKQ
jgi:2-polyprenyl-3-methyl-5-hydroxy-6-metoxy-1,4-benzoquinol methylase